MYCESLPGDRDALLKKKQLLKKEIASQHDFGCETRYGLNH